LQIFAACMLRAIHVWRESIGKRPSHQRIIDRTLLTRRAPRKISHRHEALVAARSQRLLGIAKSSHMIGFALRSVVLQHYDFGARLR
jgi:hypothetical protein